MEFAQENGTPDDIVGVTTTGQHLGSGVAIDVVRSDSGDLALLLWNERQAQIAPQIKFGGRLYRPAKLDSGISAAVKIPRGIAPYGTLKNLRQEMSKVTAQYSGLPENFIDASISFAIATWFAGSLQAAPWLSMLGCNTGLANQLFKLLGCFCRRALLLVDTTFSGIRSLPLDWGLTLMLSQCSKREQVARLLSAMHHRGGHIVHHGRLIHMFGPIVTYSDRPIALSGTGLTPIEIPGLPSSRVLPVLSTEEEERIANEFQPKLMAYFIENCGRIPNAGADLSGVPASARETGQLLLGCIPDDPELQQAVIKTLHSHHAAMQSARWTDIDVVAVEALLFLLHDGQKQMFYVGDVARIMIAIIKRRGGDAKVVPKSAGAALRSLGLHVEPRDQRGYKLRVTQALALRIHELAVALDVPSMRDDEPRCQQCKACID